MSALALAPEAAPPSHGVPIGEAMRVWARVAALSFGGPAGQIAVLHRILVDEKRCAVLRPQGSRARRRASFFISPGSAHDFPCFDAVRRRTLD